MSVKKQNLIEELKECKSLYIVKHYFVEQFDISENSEINFKGEINEITNMVYNFVRRRSFFAIGMECLSGPNFEDLEIQNYKLTLKYIINIAAGLEWLHSRNIMHRDISPKNIMANNTDNNVISI